MKYDDDKPPLHLIPSEVLLTVANVFGYGAKKYSENNWRYDVDNTSYGRTYASAQRHLNAFWRGEDIDPESGLHHLDHAITQLMILKIQTIEGPEMDDRFRRKDV